MKINIEKIRSVLLLLLIVLVVFAFVYTTSKNDVDVSGGSARPVKEMITHSELHTLAR